MTINVKSDHLLRILRATVVQHLREVWPNPRELAWLQPHIGVEPGPLQACYTDESFTQEASVQGSEERIEFVCEDGKSFEVVAALAPDISEEMGMFLTPSMEVILVNQTEAARRPDGILQIAGAEAGLVVLRPKRMLEQLREGKKILDGNTIVSLRRMVRDEEDGWRSERISLTIPSGTDAKVSMQEASEE